MAKVPVLYGDPPKPLFIDGLPAFAEDPCECCDDVDVCPCCEDEPLTRIITVDDIAGDCIPASGDDCTQWNGASYVAEKVGACQWQYFDPAVPGSVCGIGVDFEIGATYAKDCASGQAAIAWSVKVAGETETLAAVVYSENIPGCDGISGSNTGNIGTCTDIAGTISST